jgi:hypothetical protein
MSVVGEPLVLISKVSVTYFCGRKTLSLHIPTTDIGDADFRY